MRDVVPVLAHPLWRWLLTTFALSAAAIPTLSCSKKHEEPTSRPEAYQPSPMPSDAGREDAAVLRRWRTHINNEACETAAKHANLVYGRGETDPKGAILLSRCLQLGNLAWYDCVMQATAPAQVSACSKKYFDAPEP